MKTWMRIAAALTLSAASISTTSAVQAGGCHAGVQPTGYYQPATCVVPQATAVAYRSAVYVEVPHVPVVSMPACATTCPTNVCPPPACPSMPAQPAEPVVPTVPTVTLAPSAPAAVMPVAATTVVTLPPVTTVAAPPAPETCRSYTVLYRSCVTMPWVAYGSYHRASEALVVLNGIEELGYETMVR